MPPDAQALAQRALVTLTPCGTGSTVWRRWGDGSPVVLLHGGSGSWTHWVRNIAALERAGHAVHVPDMPGFGESAAPVGGEDADAIVAPLEVGLDRVVPVEFDLVGFSFGSLVAALIARRVRRVRQLVLLGAPVQPLRTGRGQSLGLTSWRELPPDAQAAAHAANLRMMMLHRPESITDDVVALHAANVPRDRMLRRRLVTTPLLADTLARLQCPVRLVYGDEDALYRSHWPELGDRIRTIGSILSVLMIRNAGHWVQFEAPAEVNPYLLQLLGRPSA
jgi:2-hydroxy-6-oxonona-2,4-dienedioate hydrolase